MLSIYEKGLVGISILLLIIGSVIAFNSSFIWMINPPHTKPDYSSLGLGAGNFEQSNSTVLQITESLLDGGTFYSPTKVRWATISVTSNNLPSVPSNTSQDKLVSLNLDFYCGLYTVNNLGSPVLLQLQNETASFNGTVTSYTKSFTWKSSQTHGLFYSGHQTIPLYVVTAYFAQEQFLSHSNQSLYNYSLPLMETSNFVLFHATPTKHLIIEGLGIPSLPSGYFSYINWGNFKSVFDVTALYTIAILIPSGILIRKKYLKNAH